MENNPETSENQTGSPVTQNQDPRQALEQEKQKAEGYLNNWKRAQADFINYKRHCEQVKQEIGQSAMGSAVLCVLPALDDLERALGSVPPDLNGSGWVEGFKLIERKIRSSLEAQGLKPIKAVGEPFDARFHEAIKQNRGQDGIVLAEVEKGYLLHDKLLRPSKVIVGNGEESDKKEE